MKYLLLPLVLLSWMSMAHGQQLTENRKLGSFNRINVDGGIDQLVLQHGAQPSVSIEASGIASDKILTEVKGNDLNISLKKGNYHGNIRMTVTYSDLEEINNSGSNAIEFADTFSGKAFTFNNSGSGNLKGKFAVEQLTLNMSGSGNATLTGKADKQYFAISGSANIRAGELKGSYASVAISGSGNAELNVDGKVDSAVAGSGKVQNMSK